MVRASQQVRVEGRRSSTTIVVQAERKGGGGFLSLLLLSESGGRCRLLSSLSFTSTSSSHCQIGNKAGGEATATAKKDNRH